MNKPKVHIVKKIVINKSTCNRLDLWFYGRYNENFILYEDKFLGVNDQILLQDIETDPKITVSKGATFLDKIYSPRSRGSIQQLVDTISRIQFLNKGFLSIHAACLAKDGESILIAAFPNVGKTLSTFQLIKEGYKYLSDDTALVDTQGNAYLSSFPSAVGHYDFLQFIRPENIGKQRYYSMLLKSKLYESNKLFGRLFNPPLLELGKIFPSEDKVKIKTVVSVEIGPKRIEQLSMKDIIQKIDKINAYSLGRLTNPIVDAYAYFNNYNHHYYYNIEQRNLMRFLGNCENFYSLSCNNWNWIDVFKEAEIV